MTGAKTYYLAGIYPALFAGGGTWYEARVASAPAAAAARRARRTAAILAAIAIVSMPIVLPVLPASTLPTGSWEGGINKDLSATVGWRDLVGQIAGIADSLPPNERAHVVVLTGDYGAAGAVDEFGGRYGLPHAISGHNNYWWWGHAGARDGATTIAVRVDRSDLTPIFDDVTLVGQVQSPHGVWTEERDAPIYVCRRQRVSWRNAWPSLRHYG